MLNRQYTKTCILLITDSEDSIKKGLSSSLGTQLSNVKLMVSII